jgi:hypothetical protein
MLSVRKNKIRTVDMIHIFYVSHSPCKKKAIFPFYKAIKRVCEGGKKPDNIYRYDG